MIRQFHHSVGPGVLSQPSRKADGDAKALDAVKTFRHPSAMEATDLISTAEVCRRYGVTRGAVRLWIADGLTPAPETPAPGPGGRPPIYLFRAADVAAYVEARKAAGRWGMGKRGPDRTPRQPGRWPEQEAKDGAST